MKMVHDINIYVYMHYMKNKHSVSSHLNWRIITTVKSVFVSKLSTDVENESRGSKLAG